MGWRDIDQSIDTIRQAAQKVFDIQEKEIAQLRTLLADQSRRIGELEGALKPFADLADLSPIMTGRGENTIAANPRDSDPFHWGQRISWGMLRRARTALKAEEGNG